MSDRKPVIFARVINSPSVSTGTVNNTGFTGISHYWSTLSRGWMEKTELVYLCSHSTTSYNDSLKISKHRISLLYNGATSLKAYARNGALWCTDTLTIVELAWLASRASARVDIMGNHAICTHPSSQSMSSLFSRWVESTKDPSLVKIKIMEIKEKTTSINTFIIITFVMSVGVKR